MHVSSEFSSIIFAEVTEMHAQQPGDVLIARSSFAVWNERLALAAKSPANLKGLAEAGSIVQELEADAASALLMRRHWC
jgi:hypothetical protein